MIEVIGFIVFVGVIALWTTRSERRMSNDSCTIEADAAIQTVRKVAKKRAHAASMPMPMDFGLTPIHGVPIIPTPTIMATQTTPVNGSKHPRPQSQPYAQHTRKAGNAKSIKR